MEEKKKYCSTQINLPEVQRISVQDWIDDHITPDMLSPDETNGPDLHVTVKYGLHNNDPKAVQALVSHFGPVQVYFGEISIFDSDPNYDVLKIDVVSSPDLIRLNKRITSNLAHTDTFPDYKPHCTLAYLKKGFYELFFGDPVFMGRGFSADTLLFCDTDKNKTKISLL